MLGGYGILYSVKADEFLFSKRREKVDSAAKALENSNLIPKDLPRLYLIKGRKHPFARQVELSWQSLNSNDCYVLDTGKFGKVSAHTEQSLLPIFHAFFFVWYYYFFFFSLCTNGTERKQTV